MAGITERIISEELQPFDPQRQITDLIADLQVAWWNAEVLIFTHLADPEVYNEQAVMNALEDAKSKQGAAAIRVITGSLIVVDEEGQNGLLVLRDKGVVDEMQHSLGTGIGFCEQFRVVYNPYRDGRIFSDFYYYPRYSTPVEERLYPRNVQSFMDTFNTWSKRNKEMSPSPVELPLLITRPNLVRLAEIAGVHEVSFIIASARQLVELPGANDLFWKPSPNRPD